MEIAQAVNEVPLVTRDFWRGKPIKVRLSKLSSLFIEYFDIERVFIDIARKTRRINSKIPNPLPPVDSINDGSINVTLGEGLMVIGGSGYGKSSLCSEILRRHPRYSQPERTIIPVVYMEVPQTVNSGTMSQSLLIALGHYDTKGKARELFIRACNLVRSCKVQIILIDNYHDIPARRATKGVADAGDWTRSIIDACPVLVIALGTNKARIVRDSNDQLRTRMMTAIALHGYLDILIKPEQSDQIAPAMRKFADFLRKLDDALPLAESSDIFNSTLAPLIFRATHGVLRTINELLSNAIAFAVEQGRERILQCDLQQGFIAMAGDDAINGNPFDDHYDGQPLTSPGQIFYKNLEMIKK